ncbi:MAG: glycosyltransferase family 9 protein [Lentisphaeria bacterium]|nr:glycosyltransferase family 9 protein [Lentisphaeria bacterium]
MIRAAGVSEEIQPFHIPEGKKTSFGIPSSGYCVICTGASHSGRCWEEEKFSTLANKLHEYGITYIVLVSGPEEFERAERIRKKCKNPEMITNLCGKTSFLQLFDVIRHAGFMVSNETGPAHVAAAFGVKTFIICGGGDYGSFVPYRPEMEGKTVFSIFRKDQHCFRCGWQNPQCRNEKIFPCISDISVEQVFTKICEGLNITEKSSK